MDFMTAMAHRFACKLYKNEALPGEEVKNLLEVGRLSPTSFGMEMVHYRAVVNPKYRKGLFHACFEQDSVKTAPLCIIPTVLRESFYEPHGDFVRQRGLRFPSTLEEYIDDFKGYYHFLHGEGRLLAWARSQSYIAVGNMMTYAWTKGIASCAIEGYKEEALLDLLNLDKTRWAVGLVCVFGYSAEEEREKIREPLEEISTVY